MIADLQEAYTKAVERAAESVVKVSIADGPMGPPFGPFPRRGHGSGVVLNQEGHIVTNQHVVMRAGKVVVTLADGRILAGSVAGGDEETDIAVVKVDGGGLKPAEFGDSDKLKAGQPVLALGNPLGLAGGPTVTSGVIGSLQRSLQLRSGDGLKVIQTDAAVNPGNSGGPLIDLQGRVIGITSVTIPYAEGIGFAVPINTALAVARDIAAHGRVQRPWLGIVGYDVNRRVAQYYGLPTTRGIFVVEVSQGGPAEGAGLRVGDVLVAFGTKPVAALADLLESLRDQRIGDAVDLEVDRQGARVRLSVRLGARPY